jgi:hypothetical protein
MKEKKLLKMQSLPKVLRSQAMRSIQGIAGEVTFKMLQVILSLNPSMLGPCTWHNFTVFRIVSCFTLDYFTSSPENEF